MKRTCLPNLLILAMLLLPFSLLANIIVDTSPGDGPPPSTLGPYDMTSFGDDARPVPNDVTNVPSPLGGDLLFSVPLSHREQGDGWTNFRPDYAGGDLYLGSGLSSYTLTLPANTTAFYFYAQTDVTSTFNITAQANDGTQVTLPVTSSVSTGGAQYFGFYVDGPACVLTSITVSVVGTSGLAVGDFGVANCGEFLVDFDGQFASNGFSSQTTPTNDYSDGFVSFSGSGNWEVLDNSSFAITGLSDPNKLAWNNTGSPASTGSTEEISFASPVTDVSFLIGSALGGTLTATAYNQANCVIDDQTVTLTDAAQLVSFSVLGISRIELTVSAGTAGCLDDLRYNTCDAVCTDLPMAICSNATVKLDPMGNGSITAADVDGGSSNPCGCPLTYSVSPNTFDCTQAGTTVPVTLTVTNANGSSTCTAMVEVEGLPCGWMDTEGIGCTSGSAYDATAGEFTVSSTDCVPAFPYTADQTGFIKFELCGDGVITALVTGVSPGGYAGVMMRESVDPGSKLIAIGTNLVNFGQRRYRVFDNYPSFPQVFYNLDKFWVRIERTGNIFRGSISADGVQWIPYMFQFLQMDECLLAGLYAEGAANTATFTNVSVMPLGGLALVEMENLREEMLLQERTFSAPQIGAVAVYPNPASDMLTVELAQFRDQEVQLTLLNSNGQQQRAFNIGRIDHATERIDLRGLSAGMYLLQITSPGQAPVIKKVMIQPR